MREIRRLFVLGFPGHYGGAGTELRDQITVWLAMGLEVNIIPNAFGYENEYLYPEMLSKGVIVREAFDWTCLAPGYPVFGFCNYHFLKLLPFIHERTKRTVFVNCMTWLFEEEGKRMQEGMIGLFLYQNEDVMEVNMPALRRLNADPDIRFMSFRPHFDSTLFPFHESRSQDFFGCGRISRRDPDKYAAQTLHIYSAFEAPVPKNGIFLGFDARSRAKTGEPFPWIRTAVDHHQISQADFYRHCEIVLQPTDTVENWPRVGLEAMASGSVLIVDNRGGWRRMVKHGETGWLCDNETDFIRYATLMANEQAMRKQMAVAARDRGAELSNLETSIKSWEKVFDVLASMPE